jgi:hypothetical protein
VNGSCSLKRLSLSPIEEPATITPINLPFSSTGTELLYKTQIDISKDHYSGLFAIRISSDETYRVVFLNELGMKFFDIETGSNGLVIHYCYNSFQRRGIRNVLEEILNTLFLTGEPFEKGKAWITHSGDHTVYPVNLGGKIFCFVNNVSGKLERIIKPGCFAEKMIIEFTDYNQFPVDIRISVPSKKISIVLNSLENQHGNTFSE